jgi:hypothetical protein
MRIAVKHVEDLGRQALDEARKSLDVPAVHDFLGRFPGGQFIRTMIRNPTAPSPVTVESTPVMHSPPEVSVPSPGAATVEPERVEPPPVVKASRRAGKPSAAKPPVPVGTRVQILTGAFMGWTGPLQWSPAKSAYNVTLTGPDGQRTRTTLSPSTFGKSWEAVIEPKGRG